jgi:predicted naringenin-chalcone synthase
MSPRLSSIGLATPAERLEQSRAADMVAALTAADERRARSVRALFRRSGVSSRSLAILRAGNGDPGAYYAGDTPPTTAQRMASYALMAAPLAEEAARRCLDHAGLDPTRVTHLVTASCTGFEAPGVDVGLFAALGLSPDVQRTHVGFMGCHAAINALRVARALAAAETGAAVLVCCAEVCSLHLQADDGDGAAVSNALFGDGAAACLVRPGRDDPDAPALRATAARLFPEARDAMTWRIGDAGFRMTLSPTLPGVLERHVTPWMDRWLDEHGLTRPGIGGWAIHPGGPRIVQTLAGAMGLHERLARPSLDVLAEHGNMSSPTVLFVLERLLRADTPRPIVALAFGPGLAGEALLIG